MIKNIISGLFFYVSVVALLIGFLGAFDSVTYLFVGLIAGCYLYWFCTNTEEEKIKKMLGIHYFDKILGIDEDEL